VKEVGGYVVPKVPLTRLTRLSVKILKLQSSEMAFHSFWRVLERGFVHFIQTLNKDYCVKFMLGKQQIFPLTFLR
jgi:hypothetical protein